MLPVNRLYDVSENIVRSSSTNLSNLLIRWLYPNISFILESIGGITMLTVVYSDIMTPCLRKFSNDAIRFITKCLFYIGTFSLYVTNRRLHMWLIFTTLSPPDILCYYIKEIMINHTGGTEFTRTST